MRTRFLVLAFTMAATSSCWIAAEAGGPEAIAADSDLGRLQGRWTARAGARKEIQVALTIDGRRVDFADQHAAGHSFPGPRRGEDR